QIELKVNEIIIQDVALDFKTLTGEKVVITAQAKGQIDAINQQLSSGTIKNVVSSARIQEVPDANAAESVGRLPGVSIKRSSGEGNEVVIRGLQPRLNVITVNNIRMPSTNEYNTAVGLAGISQYMLDGIEVRKSLTAEDDADVVGGIVDLKLATAPEGFHMNAIMDGMYNGLTNNYGSYRGTIQGSNRFFNNKLGVMAQVNIEKADRTNHALSAGFNMDTRVTDNRGVFLTNGNFQKDEIIRDRLGASVLLDYKLPKGKIQVNSIYNGLGEDRWERDYRFNVAAGAISLDKMMIAADEKNYSLVNSISLETEILGMATLDIGAALTIGNRDRTNKALGFWYDASVTEPIDPKFYEDPYGRTAYDQANLKVPFNLSSILSGFVKFGGKMRLKDRTYDYGNDGDLGGIYGGDVDIYKEMIADNPDIAWPWQWNERPPDKTALPAYPIYSDDEDDILEDRVVLEDFAKRHYVEQLVDRARASNWANLPLWKVKAQDLADDYNGDEKLYAGYLMTELNWGKNIMLNAGVRYEQEETKYKGYGVTDIASAQDILDTLDMVKRTNDYLLPSVNLRYNYASWGDVRTDLKERAVRARHQSGA
ncbi:MAG: TonB-dependent receptor, partial [bacterium]